MKLTKTQAMKLLLEAKGKAPDDNWIYHSIWVSELAGEIAEYLSLDRELAQTLGLIHDIGKMYGWKDGDSVLVHTVKGYRFLKEAGYDECYAGICLKHSFLNNDIDCLANNRDYLDPALPDYTFVKEYIEDYEYTAYDKIINLCDLMCTAEGIVSMEKRLIDLIMRKGIHKNTEYHLKQAMELKGCFEGLNPEVERLLNKES